jgi:hypothetical protein
MSEATAPAVTLPVEPLPPEVEAMREALDRGDHRQARAMAATLSASDDPALKAAGEEMAARFRRDPWIDAVFLGTGLLMVFLAVHYLGHR